MHNTKIAYKKRKHVNIPNPNAKTDEDYAQTFLLMVGKDIAESNDITEFLEEFGYLSLLKDYLDDGVRETIIGAVTKDAFEDAFIFEASEMDVTLLKEEWKEFYKDSKSHTKTYTINLTKPNGKYNGQVKSTCALY